MRAWGQGGGPEIYWLDPSAASDSLTAVLMPKGHDADRVRAIANDKYGVALGGGLGTLQGRNLRIGPMGDINESMLIGALASIELALAEAGVRMRAVVSVPPWIPFARRRGPVCRCGGLAQRADV